MLRTIRRIFVAPESEGGATAHEREQLRLAVAVLVHEARRADYAEDDPHESGAAQAALAGMLGLEPREAAALLEQGRARAQQLTSFYAPVTAIKRAFSLEERVRLVEHLWRVSFADGQLNIYEDHYVRKIAHLLHVPNTQSMLARNRARDGIRS